MKMRLLCVVAVLLCSVGVVHADKLTLTVEPATVSPGDEYTLTGEYSLDSAVVILNVVQARDGGVVIATSSAPVDKLTDPPLPNADLHVPPIVGVTPLSAIATLPDGTTVAVTPAPDGSVTTPQVYLGPGQTIALAVLMLVL